MILAPDICRVSPASLSSCDRYVSRRYRVALVFESCASYMSPDLFVFWFFACVYVSLEFVFCIYIVVAEFFFF